MHRSLAVGLACSAVVACSGCGSNAGSGVASPAQTVPAKHVARAPVRARHRVDSGRTFSTNTTVDTDNGGTLDLSVDVTMGRPSQDTTGDSPGFVNVTVPVSGHASLSNSSSYELVPPFLQVEALYPSASEVCQHHGPDAEVGGNQLNAVNAVGAYYDNNGHKLCQVLIASLNSVCSGGQQTGMPTVTPGGNADLEVDPNGSAADTSCTGQVAPGRLIFNGVRTESAAALSSAISSAPRYWAIFAETGECPQADDNQAWTVLDSKPSGLDGCF